MKNKYDPEIITDAFLDKYFPPRNRFKEITAGSDHRAYLEECLKSYLIYRDDFNQKRQRSGKSTYSDRDIADFIRHSDGIVQLKRPF